MKKLLAVLAIVAFMGSFSAPVFAADDTKPVTEIVNDEKPKKSSETKKGDKKEGCEKTCENKKKSSCGDKDKK